MLSMRVHRQEIMMFFIRWSSALFSTEGLILPSTIDHVTAHIILIYI